MSLVSITKHDENIYHLDKVDLDAESDKLTLKLIHNASKSRYVSKYHNKVIKKIWNVIDSAPYEKILSTKAGIGYHKTMGYAHQPLRNPCDFLRKNEGIKWFRKKEHICGKSLHPIPPIPKVSELPKKTPKVVKNMIQINIDNLKNTAVKRPKPKYAITNRGETRELCESGNMPAYIFQPTFGRLPNYILNYNKMICDKKTECDQYEHDQQTFHEPTVHGDANSEYYLLDQKERLHVIEGLKRNWYEKQLMYQRRPAVLDNVGQKNRVSALEKDLKQLESDIMLLEYNPKIYICK